MNYKVLYRKYRPDKFSGMVGQEYTLKMLQNAIINDKISHAYLFTGPRGTGKTSTAKIFAKTINCLNPIDGEACGQCSNCLHFSESPDIIEIDAASNNGVDDIRELINNVKIAPSEGKYKIYIIDEVHMMTTSAFNALLLTLEEPPKHAVFIMATTNVENVPITILSRCQRFNFQKISLEDLKKQIYYVCKEENIQITDEAVEEIAYLSEGGMRDALSLLDQLSNGTEEITIDKILSHYGSISSKFIKDLIKKIENSEVQSIMDSFQELENTSSDYKVFLKKMIQELTHISVNIKLGTYQGNLTFKQIKQIIFEFNEIMNKANINMNPYIMIELVLLDCLEFKEEDNSVKKSNLDFIFNKNTTNNVEKSVSSSSKKEKSELNEPENIETVFPNLEVDKQLIEELKKVRVNNCFVAAKKDILVTYQSFWNGLSSNLDIKPDLISLILDSSLVAASNEYCIIACSLPSTANLINVRLDELTLELKNVFGNEVRFIALSMEEWQHEKQKYVRNLKEKYKYEIMEEPKIKQDVVQNSSEVENVATNIFNRDKIEIV